MPIRTDIRKALKTIYEAQPGITTVYLGRRRTIPQAALPAICIYVEDEEKQVAYAEKPRVFDRRLDIVSEIHVQAADPQAVEELLDLLCDVREAAVLADETLGGLVTEIVPVSDGYDVDESGSRPAAVAECRDRVLYTH